MTIASLARRPARSRVRYREALRAVVLLALPMGACRLAPAPSELRPSPGEISLEFVDDFNAPRARGRAESGAADWDAGLGGLSGLYYDAEAQALYAASDDAGHRGPPRVYVFDVTLSASHLDLRLRSIVRLSSSEYALADVDCESIAGDGRGALFLGTEGHLERPSRPPQSILRLEPGGEVREAFALPRHVRSVGQAAEATGSRSNLGLEGLTVSPSGSWLTAIHEAALVQDGPLADFEHGTTVRLLRWRLGAETVPEEFAYRTEPVSPLASGRAPAVWHNGVSALVALDDERLLVLERAYVAAAGGRGENVVRVFEVVIDAGAGRARIRDPARIEGALDKRLVLDLSEIVPRLEPGHQSLDNFEGMTLGPRLPTGERSLLLVSDDNFNPRQRTVFVALRIVE